MLRIKNMGPKAFKNYIKDKRVIIFGAGRALESCFDIYFNCIKSGLIVDNNKHIWGKKISYNDKDYEIFPPHKIIEEVQNNGKGGIVCFITSSIYAAEIIEELDRVRELEGMECFVRALVSDTKEWLPDYEFTRGKSLIPKKIHYVWLGGGELPDEYKKNIETWKNNNPDYEFIQWNEETYDLDKYSYVREAYEAKEWAFASNLIRFDVIYKYGGIYLDTDVEVRKSMDCLLNDEAFFGMGRADSVNVGGGFGACANHPLIKNIFSLLSTSHFITTEGKKKNIPLHSIIHPIIREWGFTIENCYQNVKGVALYPKEVFSPVSIYGYEDYYSDKTISVHKENGSWKNEIERNKCLELKDKMRRRIIND